MYKKTLFIFRQDLRLQDNTALIQAIKDSESIFPIFIRDTRAIDDFWRDDSRFGFIREALEQIDVNLQSHGGRLSVYEWDPTEVVATLIDEHHIDAVYLNRSYSPHGVARDTSLRNLAQQKGVEFCDFLDFLLVEPHEVEQRKVFTPFSLLWKKFLLAHLERLIVKNISLDTVKWCVPSERKDIHDIIAVPHHRYWTMELWKKRMERDFSRYDEERNLPGVDGSTRLSPYIRFGVFSIREIYTKVSENPTLLSEIIWREFWYHIAHYFPETYHLEFQEKRRNITWKTDTESDLWKCFENAETGYPLVDAAIKQLYETNWMHNRLRMVVASFLTKNLGYDWRIWEKWFKKYLIDYDEAVNIGNWQWSASVGADPKPVRIFNPLLQSERFDSEAKFIKKYIKELEWVNAKDIHTLNLSGRYIAPVVDQKESAARARERYRGGI